MIDLHQTVDAPGPFIMHFRIDHHCDKPLAVQKKESFFSACVLGVSPPDVRAVLGSCLREVGVAMRSAAFKFFVGHVCFVLCRRGLKCWPMGKGAMRCFMQESERFKC